MRIHILTCVLHGRKKVSPKTFYRTKMFVAFFCTFSKCFTFVKQAGFTQSVNRFLYIIVTQLIKYL